MYAPARKGTQAGGSCSMRLFNRRVGWGSGAVILALACAPALARADYVPPPPEPGYEYIFDGTATGSDASFDKAAAANGATAVTLDPEPGPPRPTTPGCGMQGYPVRPRGNAVVKLDFMWPEGATPNGGVMVRFPDPRYSGTTAEVLAQKPTGYNYDVCPSAAPAFCG